MMVRAYSCRRADRSITIAKLRTSPKIKPSAGGTGSRGNSAAPTSFDIATAGHDHRFRHPSQILPHGVHQPIVGTIDPGTWPATAAPNRLDARAVTPEDRGELRVRHLHVPVARARCPIKVGAARKFGTRNRPARITRNPRTGGSLSIPASTAPVFKAGKPLKDAVKSRNSARTEFGRYPGTREAREGQQVEISRYCCNDRRRRLFLGADRKIET